MARRLDLPLLNVEDAFLRSLHAGEGAGYGLLIDAKALHFDAHTPSTLAEILTSAPLDDADKLDRARAGIAFLKDNGLSKYSDWLPDAPLPEPATCWSSIRPRGDAAIGLSGADAARFAEMLDAARADYPDDHIVIRTHPVTASGRRQGHFGHADLDHRTTICAEPVNPWALLDRARAVYCVSSQLWLRGGAGGQETGDFRAAILCRLGADRGSVPRAHPDAQVER